MQPELSIEESITTKVYPEELLAVRSELAALVEAKEGAKRPKPKKGEELPPIDLTTVEVNAALCDGLGDEILKKCIGVMLKYHPRCSLKGYVLDCWMATIKDIYSLQETFFYLLPELRSRTASADVPPGTGRSSKASPRKSKTPAIELPPVDLTNALEMVISIQAPDNIITNQFYASIGAEIPVVSKDPKGKDKAKGPALSKEDAAALKVLETKLADYNGNVKDLLEVSEDGSKSSRVSTKASKRGSMKSGGRSSVGGTEIEDPVKALKALQVQTLNLLHANLLEIQKRGQNCVLHSLVRCSPEDSIDSFVTNLLGAIEAKHGKLGWIATEQCADPVAYELPMMMADEDIDEGMEENVQQAQEQSQPEVVSPMMTEAQSVAPTEQGSIASRPTSVPVRTCMLLMASLVTNSGACQFLTYTYMHVSISMYAYWQASAEGSVEPETDGEASSIGDAPEDESLGDIGKMGVDVIMSFAEKLSEKDKVTLVGNCKEVRIRDVRCASMYISRRVQVYVISCSLKALQIFLSIEPLYATSFLSLTSVVGPVLAQ